MQYNGNACRDKGVPKYAQLDKIPLVNEFILL